MQIQHHTRYYKESLIQAIANAGLILTAITLGEILKMSMCEIWKLWANIKILQLSEALSPPTPKMAKFSNKRINLEIHIIRGSPQCLNFVSEFRRSRSLYRSAQDQADFLDKHVWESAGEQHGKFTVIFNCHCFPRFRIWGRWVEYLENPVLVIASPSDRITTIPCRNRDSPGEGMSCKPV